jgi:hypothetical protein
MHGSAVNVVPKQLVGREEDADVAHRAQVHKLVQLVLNIALMDQVHVQTLENGNGGYYSAREWEWRYHSVGMEVITQLENGNLLGNGNGGITLLENGNGGYHSAREWEWRLSLR